MEPKVCAKCGHDMSERENVCSYCAHYAAPKLYTETTQGLIGAFVLALLSLLVFMLWASATFG